MSLKDKIVVVTGGVEAWASAWSRSSSIKGPRSAWSPEAPRTLRR
jgi:hypothetical protein